jgi:LPS sulfotransferase NodH
MSLLPGKFVLFAQGRTGSTLLGDLLDQHPQVYFGHEILAQRVRSPRSTIERMRFRHARHVVGFHVKIYQLTDEQRISNVGGWIRNLSRCGWQVISLRRENLLRHVLSNITAIQAQRYDDRSGAPAPVRVHVDPENLLTWMRTRERVGRDESAALKGVPHLALGYETDLQDSASWQATARAAFEYLDLEPVEVNSTLSRLNVGRLEDLIENYAEVAEAVTAAGYARYLR